MPAWLVTGASGFLGRHLLDLLKSALAGDVEVVTLGRRPFSGQPPGSHVILDLDDREGLASFVKKLAPVVVFHLAGQTPPASSENLYRANTLATVALLDSLRALSQPARVVLVGSAAELGPVPVESLPVHEDFACHPVGVYGLSKWLATAAGLAASDPLEVMVARVFNPIGPGLPDSQALGRFARVLADGNGPCHLKVGDLNTRRDFIDVRDVASALIALADRGQAGLVYHVGTGRSQRVGQGLERLIAWSGRDVTIEVDPALTRDPGPADSRADIRRIQELTGWEPRFSFDQSLHDLWREVSQAVSGSG